MTAPVASKGKLFVAIALGVVAVLARSTGRSVPRPGRWSWRPRGAQTRCGRTRRRAQSRLHLDLLVASEGVRYSGAGRNDYTWQVTAPNGQRPRKAGRATVLCRLRRGITRLSYRPRTRLPRRRRSIRTARRSTFLGPPPAPAGFTTTLVSSSEVDLEWTAATTGLSGFVIQESDGSGGGWSQVAAVDAGTNDLAVPVTLATQGCYEFEIQSVNTLGVESAPATLAVLASPTLSAVSDTEVSVSWQLPSNVASYALQRSDDDGNTWTPVDTAGAVTTGGTTYVTDSGLSGGTSYEYQLTATLADTTAATSVAATVTTLQSAGNTLTATYVSGNEIDLAWQANYPTSEGFEVDESTDNGKTFNQVGTARAGRNQLRRIRPGQHEPRTAIQGASAGRWRQAAPPMRAGRCHHPVQPAGSAGGTCRDVPIRPTRLTSRGRIRPATPAASSSSGRTRATPSGRTSASRRERATRTTQFKAKRATRTAWWPPMPMAARSPATRRWSKRASCRDQF